MRENKLNKYLGKTRMLTNATLLLFGEKTFKYLYNPHNISNVNLAKILSMLPNKL